MSARTLGLWVAVAVAMRLLFDLWVDVPTRVAGLNLAQAGTLLCMGLFTVVSAVHRRRVTRTAWVGAALWAALLVMAWGRGGADGAVAVGLRYASGPLVALAVCATWSREHRRVWKAATVLVGLVVVLGCAVSLGRGGWVQLHDTWRYMGPYTNLHALALATALIVTISTTVWADASWPATSRVTAAGVAVAATAALAASATRSGVLFVAVFLVAWALLARRWRWALVSVAAVAVTVVVVPSLRVRFAELALAAVGVAPEAGWEWLGTGRVAIWTRSWEAFQQLDPADRWLGRGLAGYETFWRGKEPHSEYLALYYQFGVAGPLLFLATGVATVARAVRRRAERDLPVMGALVVAVLVTSAVGSTLLVRMPLSWAFWAAVGAVWTTSHPASMDRT